MCISCMVSVHNEEDPAFPFSSTDKFSSRGCRRTLLIALADFFMETRKNLIHLHKLLNLDDFVDKYPSKFIGDNKFKNTYAG